MTEPAYLLDSLWNARAWNRPAADLFVGWLDGALDGALDGTGDRNLLRYVFLSPVARRIIPDWQARARRVLAEFRGFAFEAVNFLDDFYGDQDVVILEIEQRIGVVEQDVGVENVVLHVENSGSLADAIRRYHF